MAQPQPCWPDRNTLCLVDEQRSGDLGVWIFEQPIDAFNARSPEELKPACTAIDRASGSCHIILLLDYEVGCWLEPKLPIADQANTLASLQAWVFEKGQWLDSKAFENWLASRCEPVGLTSQPSGIAGLNAALTEPEYAAALETVLRHLAAGDVYQVNLTWRIDFAFFGSPLTLYRKLRNSQPVKYGACLLVGDRAILSLSPELFLERSGDWLIARPMKGTRAKGKDESSEIAKELAKSEKDRAENLMIVDLIRNDLGKIAEVGSVRVDQLFSIEEYPTVYQMVSQVSARVPDRSFYHTLKALFPCGSVTGAPKIRAMEIINDIERSPRGIYTGTIGHIKPNGDFRLNVAIRTIELRSHNHGHMHVGSGIVADSAPASEYAECWSKARFLTELPHDFSLLETVLLEHGEVKRFEKHLQRLKESAQFFGFKYKESAIRETILCKVQNTPGGRYRIRLALHQDGESELQLEPLLPLLAHLSVTVAAEQTTANDPLLRHKTTARQLFDDTVCGLQKEPEIFDALFFNERNELTQGARSNVFLVRNGSWFTPPVESGLLNGIIRQEIVSTMPVCEQRLYYEDLVRADVVYLSNALRGLFKVSLNSKSVESA